MRTFARVVAAVLLVGGVAPEVVASEGRTATYTVSGVTSVKRVGYEPAIVEDGGVVCRQETLEGVGGTCLPFDARRPYVAVRDESSGNAIPFVVCIDNDGDSTCNPHASGKCADDAFSSHDDSWVPDEHVNDVFFNPIGPLPTRFRSGCAGGPFRGYIVFICQGAHAGAPTPEVFDPPDGRRAEEPNDGHTATTGTAQTTVGKPSGYGDHCQDAGSVKRYVVA